jgi:hypothetical protein
MSLVEYSAWKVFSTTQSLEWEGWLTEQDHPFNYIGKTGNYAKYEIEDMFELAPGDRSVTLEEMKSFPNNILKVMFAQSTDRDTDEWRIIGICNENIYFYLQARSTYTGFDVGGEMKLCVSRDKKIFEEKCLDDITRYLIQTSDLPQPPLFRYGTQPSSMIGLASYSAQDRMIFGP